jgi:hypothetical protein
MLQAGRRHLLPEQEIRLSAGRLDERMTCANRAEGEGAMPKSEHLACASAHPRRLAETTSAQFSPPQSGVMTISGENLRAAYLTAPMMHYFRKKLAEVAEDELLARIEEALKYLAISQYCKSAIPVTREIDDIWHYWILQTQEYEQLCRALPGGEFIHHSSNDYLEYGDPEIGARWDMRADVEMLAIYVANFGPFVASRVRYWHLAAFLIDKRGWSLDELNQWLGGSPATEMLSSGIAGD